jgi:hypothetical protein
LDDLSFTHCFMMTRPKLQYDLPRNFRMTHSTIECIVSVFASLLNIASQIAAESVSMCRANVLAQVLVLVD